MRSRPARRDAQGVAPADVPEAAENVYLYGVVRWPVHGGAKALGTGVGYPPGRVRPVRSGGVAALVSDVSAADMSEQGVRGLRRDMKAHSALLNAVAARTTVLPMRFGVVLPNDRELVERVLAPREQQLEQLLDQLDGTIEVTFRATYVEAEVLREVVAARPELAQGSPRRAGGRSALSASESRIELGRHIAAAIEDERGHDGQALIDALSPFARDVRVGKPVGELMILNASFLVGKAELPKFDRALERINAEAGHRMTFDCVGPLPPFSFVDLRL